jgi:hypothetical protein
MSNATPTGDITMFTTTKIALYALIILATAFSASAATKPRITLSEHIAIHQIANDTTPNPQVDLDRRRTFSLHVKPVPGGAALRRHGTLLIAHNELPL